MMNSNCAHLRHLSRCLRQPLRTNRDVTKIIRDLHNLEPSSRRSFTLTARRHVARPSRPPPAPRPIGQARGSNPGLQNGVDPLFEADQSIRASLRRLDTLMQGKKVNEALTFYRAPSHRSFSLLAYAVGGFLIYETFLFARFALFEGPNEPNPNQPRRMPGWQKSILYAELGAVALLGTALFFSPMKLVRRISLVKQAAAPAAANAAAARAALAAPERYLLEIDVHHFTPLFGRGSTLRYPLEAVQRKQRFAGQDFGLRDVPFADAEAFSQEPWTRPARGAVETERRRGLSSPMLRAVVRDIKRIWVRDQMDYITLPDQGVFKVDLQEAFVLDEGRPFVGLLENVEHVPGMWQKIRMMFSLPG